MEERAALENATVELLVLEAVAREREGLSRATGCQRVVTRGFECKWIEAQHPSGCKGYKTVTLDHVGDGLYIDQAEFDPPPLLEGDR